MELWTVDGELKPGKLPKLLGLHHPPFYSGLRPSPPTMLANQQKGSNLTSGHTGSLGSWAKTNLKKSGLGKLRLDMLM